MNPKEEVRHRLPVEEVVGEYLELRPAGGGSLKTVCPFHSEKTPSFYVSKEKQIWHCFGCDKGGDIFSFVMEMEGIEFPEALRLLAKKAGVEIPRYDSTQSNERSRLVELNELARRFFEKVYLDSSASADARAYVASRGISEVLREEFGLGYAPNAWDKLVSFLGKRGYGNGEMVAAGLALNRKEGSGVIDRFRDRLMVPLLDAHGNTVAFTGRVLPGADEKSGSEIPSKVEGPKYMNSPETAVYHKSELLYGLSKAKQAIKMEKSAIIVEGNLDVIASHKADVKNVVASSGTALTQAQIQLLSRYTDTLVFCFDRDAAGFNAALRGIRLAAELRMRVQVLLIPKDAGKDPDDVVRKDPELWKKIVAAPVPLMEYYFEQATHGKDLNEVEAKRKVGHFLIEEIGRLEDPIEREHWLSKLGDLLRMDANILRGMINKDAGHPEKKSETSEARKAEKLTRMEKVLEVLVALFLQIPSERDRISRVLDALPVSGSLTDRLYRLAQVRYHALQQNLADATVFFSALEDDVKGDADLTRALGHLSLLGERLVSEVPQAETPSYIEDHLCVLKDEQEKRRREAWQRELHAAEARGDEEAVNRLLKLFK